jgi:hypothetical protein
MRVLVAEDARSLADRVAEGLGDQGMAVDIARDGLEAAAKLDVNAYDVVLLDRGRLTTGPGQRPGAWAPTTTCPSRSTSPSSCCASAPSPAASTPREPACCARPGSSSTPPRGSRPATHGRWDLSVKEFAVLEALLHASPAFLSAEDLLETAWDEHADPFTTTVTISRLRRKLGDPPVITTTPGVGYRIPSQTAQGLAPRRSPLTFRGRGQLRRRVKSPVERVHRNLIALDNDDSVFPPA